jgi:hypothetical protein
LSHQHAIIDRSIERKLYSRLIIILIFRSKLKDSCYYLSSLWPL